jgi:hypothetical protein
MPKKPTKKYMSYRRRHFGMTALNRIHAKKYHEKVFNLEKTIKYMLKSDPDDVDLDFIEGLIELESFYMLKAFKETELDPDYYDPLPPIQRKHRTIDSFTDEECHANFRFSNKTLLMRLLTGWQFPMQMVDTITNTKFSGEEVLLSGLYRLHC